MNELFFGGLLKRVSAFGVTYFLNYSGTEVVVSRTASFFHRHPVLRRFILGGIALCVAAAMTKFLLDKNIVTPPTTEPQKTIVIAAINLVIMGSSWFFLSMPHILYSRCQKRQQQAVAAVAEILERTCRAIIKRDRRIGVKTHSKTEDICSCVLEEIQQGRNRLLCNTPNALYFFCHEWKTDITTKLDGKSPDVLNKVREISEKSPGLKVAVEKFCGKKMFILPDMRIPATQEFFTNSGDAKIWGADLPGSLSKEGYTAVKKSFTGSGNKGTTTIFRTPHNCSFRILVIDDTCFIQEAYSTKSPGKLKSVKYFTKKTTPQEFTTIVGCLQAMAQLLHY